MKEKKRFSYAIRAFVPVTLSCVFFVGLLFLHLDYSVLSKQATQTLELNPLGSLRKIKASAVVEQEERKAPAALQNKPIIPIVQAANEMSFDQLLSAVKQSKETLAALGKALQSQANSLDAMEFEINKIKLHSRDIKNFDAGLYNAMLNGFIEIRGSAEKNFMLRLCYVPPGVFRMGFTQEDRIRRISASGGLTHFNFSHPEHFVRIDEGFFIAETETTVSQWNECFRKNSTPSDFPITNVDRNSAIQYCDWLCSLNPGLNIRLPSETEFEYAARGPFFIEHANGGHVANSVKLNTQPRMLDVLTMKNQFVDVSWCGAVGLNSNVSEFTIDGWDEDLYSKRVQANPASLPPIKYLPPAWPLLKTDDVSYVLRGASFNDPAFNCHPAVRRPKVSDFNRDDVGFRVLIQVHSVKPK
jgi:formylglycine-generating enzyme required for sulfatase activity